MTGSYAERFEQFLDRRSVIHSLEGKVAYTVMHFPIDKLRKQVPREMKYSPDRDVYTLRTANSVDEAVQTATEEIKTELGFDTKLFNPRYNTGDIIFDDKEVIVISSKKSIRGMTHWVAEGLVGMYLNDVKDGRRVRTERKPTGKLYQLHHYEFKLHNIMEAKLDLVELLTGQEQIYIKLSPTYKNEDLLFQASRGNEPIIPSIINFGSVRHDARHRDSSYKPVTGFLDPDTNMVYSLLHGTKIIEKLVETKGEWVQDNIQGPWENMEWHKIAWLPNYFFDGSLKDIFNLLKEKGITIKEA